MLRQLRGTELERVPAGTVTEQIVRSAQFPSRLKFEMANAVARQSYDLARPVHDGIDHARDRILTIVNGRSICCYRPDAP